MDGNDQTELALAASLDAGRGVARGGSLEILLVALSLAAGWVPLAAQEAGVPDYLADRGRGIAMSLFGTYVERGERRTSPRRSASPSASERATGATASAAVSGAPSAGAVPPPYPAVQGVPTRV